MDEEYRRLVEEISDAYWVIQDEKVVLVNSRHAGIYGYTKDESLGRHFLEVVAPEDKEQVADYYRRAMSGQLHRQRFDCSVLAKDGSRMWIEVTAWTTVYNRRPAVAGITRAIQNTRSDYAVLIHAQEDERKRLARLLHDNTIQELLLVCQQLQDIAEGKHGQIAKQAKERLAEVRGLIDQSRESVRRLTQELRPAVLDDMGLVSALRWFADKTLTTDSVDVEVIVMGEERRLQPDKELACFRIGQEALMNIRRHARASAVTITIRFERHRVTMTVSDNGGGFRWRGWATGFSGEDKFGIRGMRERALLIGGGLSVRSKVGKGTAVSLEVPV